MTAPLPPAVLIALRSIRTDLRNLPRDCIVDRAELLHWLNRMARRVEGVEQMKVAASVSPRQQRMGNGCSSPRPPQRCAAAPREAAEVVFNRSGKVSAQLAPKLTKRRTVTSRKGKSIPVETRQLPLWQEL